MSTSNGILPDMEKCILELFRIGSVKFGDFVLKSGNRSPIYMDLRIIVSYPEILELVSDLIWQTVKGESYDHICGVPYTALPIATVIANKERLPMLVRRKEAKSYGTKKMIEGIYKDGDSCLIIEDVIVSGSSLIETADLLRSEKLNVKKAVVFLDREQGGSGSIKAANVDLVSVITIRQMLDILEKHQKIDNGIMQNVMNYWQSNQNVLVLDSKTKGEGNGVEPLPTLTERAQFAKNALSRRLFTLMERKQSNLCVAADVQTTAELLVLADKVGPYICLLKTHVDILDDFSQQTIEGLKAMAAKHDFLLFEDRKFGDIGNTVKHQYCGGAFKISKWAHLVTVHGAPGPGLIKGLMSSTDGEERGCVIVAQMSSEKNLIDTKYTEGCRLLARQFPSFVVGLVSQSPMESWERAQMINFMPGVSLSSSGDALGQQYISPEDAVGIRGADVLIVGRGVTADQDPAKRAAVYQQRGYQALLKKLSLYCKKSVVNL